MTKFPSPLKGTYGSTSPCPNQGISRRLTLAIRQINVQLPSCSGSTKPYGERLAHLYGTGTVILMVTLFKNALIAFGASALTIAVGFAMFIRISP